MLEPARLAQEITPFATAAITAYGAAVLSRVEGSGADATVAFGQRVLRRLTGRDAAPDEPTGEPTYEPTGEQNALANAVRALAAVRDGTDLTAVLRVHILRLLLADPALLAEIAGWPRPVAPVEAAVTVTTSGERSPAVHTNHGTIHTGNAVPRTAP